MIGCGVDCGEETNFLEEVSSVCFVTNFYLSGGSQGFTFVAANG